MSFSPSLFLHDLTVSLRNRAADGQQTRARAGPRPEGQILWIHVQRRADHEAVVALIGELSDRSPDLWFLVTTPGEAPDGLGDQCRFQPLPVDTRANAIAFLDHWRPDLSVWITDCISPAFMHEAAQRGIALFMLDTGVAVCTARRTRPVPWLTRRTLRLFDGILSGDETTSQALISAGARRSNVHTVGVLEQTRGALPCQQAEWEEMLSVLSTRPVWLAAEISKGELDTVIAAQIQAQRRSHRLLLILVPEKADETGDDFAQALRAAGVDFARRSTGEVPDAVHQVYLADTEGEMGLWYRLSPVSLLGQTFRAGTTGGPDPFDAAALGSVVLHGPLTRRHEIAFQRLARAGASREIRHGKDLAQTVEAVLAPDRAALMAHAAWQIGSAGSEATARAVDMLDEALCARAEKSR